MLTLPPSADEKEVIVKASPQLLTVNEFLQEGEAGPEYCLISVDTVAARKPFGKAKGMGPQSLKESG